MCPFAECTAVIAASILREAQLRWVTLGGADRTMGVSGCYMIPELGVTSMQEV